MNKSKILTVCLFFVLILSSIVACSKNNNTATDSADYSSDTVHTIDDSSTEKNGNSEGKKMINDPDIINESQKEADIKIDFGSVEGMPIFKKFNAMISGWIGESILKNCSKSVSNLRVDNLRFDLSASAYGINSPDSSYEAINRMIKSYVSKGVMPYTAYFPQPTYLYSGKDKSTTMPNSLKGWKEFCRDYAEDLRLFGFTSPGHEIWNEPDLDWAFDGSYEDYYELYHYGVEGVLEGDPDAVVGGLSAGELNHNVQFADSFVKYCIDNNIPLDFVSYHAYNKVTTSYGQDPVEYTEIVRAILNRYDLKSVRLHLTEYNITQGQDTMKYSAPAKTLEQFERINNLKDVELVHIAAFYDPNNNLCMVNTRLQEMAMYWALQYYNNMPFLRNRVANSSKVSVIASSDENRACTILYNMSGKERECTISFDNIPFEKGNVTIYLINEQYSRFENNCKDFHIAYMSENVELHNIKFDVKLGKYDSVYVTIDDGSGLNTVSAVESDKSIGKYIRKDYLYGNRNDDCYSEFDRLSQTSLMGMGNVENSLCQCSVIYDNVADIINLFIVKDGLDDKGKCGIQIAYHTPDGYTKAIYYPISSNQNTPEFLWTETDEFGANLLEKSSLTIKENAPENFDGRIRISFAIENMPKDSYVLVRLEK